ncbi:MAG: hypothetical protein DCC55_14085 [Chloroflexi bacterium]|nr:MAG: hypothetical protein DCC55_14085 [Chloroflexota bacterium]
MAETMNRISFDEFSTNLTRIFDRVTGTGEEIVVETGAGDLVALKPLTRVKPRRRRKTRADYEAFLSSAGGWRGVDVDAFLKENYQSRRISTCPVVEL